MVRKLLIMGMVMSLLISSGCKTSDKDREDFEREYRRHGEPQEEPYILIP